MTNKSRKFRDKSRLMGNFIDKGNDGFASVRNTNFVDKSMLIEEVNSVMLTENRYMCVTRARRFGKSVAVKMLNAYYDRSCNSESLFEGLEISRQPDFKKHLNHFPVLYLDMTDFVTKYGDDNHLIDKMKQDICNELLNVYEGVAMNPNDDLMDLLVSIVDNTGEKFVCLIDEWDALCREGYEKLMDEYVDFLRRLFKGSKTEYVFTCVYMTGILPIKRYNTQSALNNFEEYTMLSPAQLAPYFGFTEKEVLALCKVADMDAHEMKLWYDGYELGNEKAIYNPFAVMRALKRRSFSSYWTSTNTFEDLRRYITMNFEGLKDDIVSAFNDIPVKVNSLRFSNDMHKVDCKDDVLTLLCHLGYLSYNDATKCACIPNYEVRQEFETAIADTGWAEVTDALKQSEYLLSCVLNGDAEIVATHIDTIHEQNTKDIVNSLFKYMPYGPMFYDEDTVTDQPQRQIVAEIIREKALHALDEEIPHGIAVTIEKMRERKGQHIVDIEATIICERDSHKGIIIGKQGSMLKKIGSNARFEIEKMLEERVNLKIWVKVKKDWRDSDTLMKNFGYNKKEI